MKAKFVTALFLLMAASGVKSQTIPSSPHIVVNGYAERIVKPDLFILPLEITTISKDPSTAGQIELQTLNMVKKLKNAGLKDEDIKVDNLVIDKEYDKQRFIGNYYTRSLEIAFHDKKTLIQFLSSIEDIKNLEIGSIERKIKNVDLLKFELMKEAVSNSKHRAEMLASHYGMRVLGVHAISTTGITGDVKVGGSYDSGYGDARTLDRVEVTGSRISRKDLLPPVIQLLEEGTILVKENIYAVFLIGK